MPGRFDQQWHPTRPPTLAGTLELGGILWDALMLLVGLRK